VPDHSTFSKNRHGRFRQSDLFRRVFESVLRRCVEERLVGGEGFASSIMRLAANCCRIAVVASTSTMIAFSTSTR
jgi:transposase